MDVQERRPPPAIPERDCTHRRRNRSGGNPEDIRQEDQQEGGGERHRGVGRGGRNHVRQGQQEKREEKSTKDATARDATDRIAANFDDILLFLQAVALKSPQVQAAPLSLRAYKRVTGWSLQWEDSNLKRQTPPIKAASKITPDS